MPEHIRALFVILFLSLCVFVLAKKATSQILEPADFTRRRNLWLGLTIIAFLMPDFWIYVGIATVVLYFSLPREHNKVALFLILLFVVPRATVTIPGIGGINYFFALSHQRLLSLTILLPAFFLTLKQQNTIRFGKLLPDKVLTAYLVLTICLTIRDTSLTDTLRQMFYLLLDVFLPYFVISRALKTKEQFHDAMLALLLALMVVALIAAFEAKAHWLLYNPLTKSLEMKGGMLGYLGRDGALRATASAGQPIALGYLMVVALGLFLFLKKFIQKRSFRILAWLLLIVGLIAPLSRGPWIGAAVLIVIYLATGPQAIKRLTMLFLIATLSLPLATVIPGGQKVIDLLPFIGTVESGNIDYRQQLIQKASIVIARNPWFGSVNYLDTPEMQSMMQGQGIIDVVNSYIGIALESGLTGLALFVGFFLTVIFQVYGKLRSIPYKNSENALLGRGLLATLLSIMVIIATVSSITIIPIMYWSIAGFGVAYIQLMKRISLQEKAP
jgi:O-antigen ligase